MIEMETHLSSTSSARGQSLSDYDFDLPAGLIAQYPAKDRTSARLLFASLKGGYSHYTFRDISRLLVKGDVLVLNDTKVIPARLKGLKDTGAQVEVFLLKEESDGLWEALVKPSGRIKKGSFISLGNRDSLRAEVLDDPRKDSGVRRIRFPGGAETRKAVWEVGHIPLPPYICRDDNAEDREYYQTVYAQKEGAVAAPTAGLHFDEKLLDELRSNGIEIVYVTLHTGYGTFQPVQTENLTDHRMFYEDYEIGAETARAVTKAKSEGRRIIACGTTVVRALESAAEDNGPGLIIGRGSTNLFVYPPYRFKIISGLITNFHLPKSSLLMLVAAFLGYERLKAAYEEAVKKEYRFYSYGDAMFIL